jgi:hypothetical protein
MGRASTPGLVSVAFTRLLSHVQVPKPVLIDCHVPLPKPFEQHVHDAGKYTRPGTKQSVSSCFICCGLFICINTRIGDLFWGSAQADFLFYVYVLLDLYLEINI